MMPYSALRIGFGIGNGVLAAIGLAIACGLPAAAGEKAAAQTATTLRLVGSNDAGRNAAVAVARDNTGPWGNFASAQAPPAISFSADSPDRSENVTASWRPSATQTATKTATQTATKTVVPRLRFPQGSKPETEKPARQAAQQPQAANLTDNAGESQTGDDWRPVTSTPGFRLLPPPRVAPLFPSTDAAENNEKTKVAVAPARPKAETKATRLPVIQKPAGRSPIRLVADPQPIEDPPPLEQPPADPPPLEPPPTDLPPPEQPPAERPAPDGPAKIGPFEVFGESGEITVTRRRNKVLRAAHNIYRLAVVDPSVCDVAQFTPREVSLIGKGQGATHVTFWFADGKHQPVTYLVRVVPDPEVQDERERQYDILEEILAELFPDSKVRLLPVADKLIVKGQAKDAEEAAQILAIVRGEAVYGGRAGDRGYGGLVTGRAVGPLSTEETGTALPASNVINMLRIPGVQQVALRVKIAELNRSAARNYGVNLSAEINLSNTGSLLLQSLLNTTTANVLATFDADDVSVGIHYLQRHGVVRILSEPTLVTMSGHSASFVAGGEFAVPTTVGIAGASAVTTDFRSFGAILNFLPVVVDKDRIRLEISPEFSQVDDDLTVGGTPGLSTRAVSTTVEMREGQTLAIAGLLEDAMTTGNASDLPFLEKLIGKRELTRNETELIILVTPELVHPMEPEEVPPLPGFDVTEPTKREFMLGGRIEGRPTHGHDSNVWPRLRRRYRAGGTDMISGPFGHGQ